MAGIGFELSKLLRDKSLSSIFKAYGYSMAIAAGPWMISIISMLVVGRVARPFVKDPQQLTQFQVAVTYLIALSMLFTSPLQLYFTRYIADRIFEKDIRRILPNTLGAVLLIIAAFSVTLYPVFIISFRELSPVFAVFFIMTLGLMGSIWLLNTLLTGIKDYKYIGFSFLSSYLLIIAGTYFLSGTGLRGLMLAFFLGQALLFFLLLGAVIYHYPSDRLVEFDFLRKNRLYPVLIITGTIYNLAIWADKFIFWFHPETGDNVLGPLKNSVIYDLPIFLAYLAIAPGMSIMFLRLETDFVEAYDGYFSAVTTGENLRRIYNRNAELAAAARLMLVEVLRIQAIVTIGILLASDLLFDFFGLPRIYQPLFHIDLIGTQAQLFFTAVLSLLFYLNRQKECLGLVTLLLVLNTSLSWLSIYLGPFFHGYGFTVSFIITGMLGVVLLNRLMTNITYETFMLS